MNHWLKVFCLIFICFTCLPAAAQDISIGCYIPMTGSAAAMGQVAWKGIEIAHRLKPEVLGKKVKLILVDTKSDKIEAANAVSRLIEKDKVAAIIGEVISGDTLAGRPHCRTFCHPQYHPHGHQSPGDAKPAICLPGLFCGHPPGTGGGPFCQRAFKGPESCGYHRPSPGLLCRSG